MRLSLLTIYTDANDVSMNFKLSTIKNQGWSVHRVVGTPPGAYSCGNLWREKSSDRLPVIFALRAAASAPRCRAGVWGGVSLVVYAFFTAPACRSWRTAVLRDVRSRAVVGGQ